MINWDIEVLDSAETTQGLLFDRISDVSEGLVIQALEQKGGRGRQGRVWDSPRGNLYLSFVLRPYEDVSCIGRISLMVAVALARAVEAVSEHKPSLKWPNDVLVDGKKCAGILIHSDMDRAGLVKALVIGVGVNISHAPDYGFALGGDVMVLRDAFLDQVGQLYNMNFTDVREAWLSYAHNIGAVLKVRRGDGFIEGSFEGLDAEGNLLLNADGQRLVISSGDVYL